ncbi:MAG: hypothetical protein ABEJ07_02325 [Candidatus Nanohaloarchaea archaeon]
MAVEDNNNSDYAEISESAHETLEELEQERLVTVLRDAVKAISPEQTAGKTGFTPGTVSHKRSELVDRGILEKTGQTRATTYHLTPEASDILVARRDSELREELVAVEHAAHLVSREGMIEQSDVREILDITDGYASILGQRFEDEGLIERVKDGRHFKWRLLEEEDEPFQEDLQHELAGAEYAARLLKQEIGELPDGPGETLEVPEAVEADRYGEPQLHLLDPGNTGIQIVEKLLERNDGVMKQKELGEKLDWSAGKISKMLSEMENAGEVSRLRIGRENSIRLETELESMEEKQRLVAGIAS